MTWFLLLPIAFLSTTVAGQEPPPEPSAPLVVIDAGHGGSNTGAQGPDGVHEKEVTLVLAKKLERRLTARGIRVALTRTRDEYLTLRQRVRQANRWQADLFLSLHCNGSEDRQQKGYETFVLTPRAIEVDGPALRATDGPARLGVTERVARVLDDVERGAVQDEAASLAARVQRRLRALRGDAGDRGVRQDAMHVLLGATMPAVLVEFAFITHPVEGRELLKDATQDAFATAVADAVVDHLRP